MCINKEVRGPSFSNDIKRQSCSIQDPQTYAFECCSQSGVSIMQRYCIIVPLYKRYVQVGILLCRDV